MSWALNEWLRRMIEKHIDRRVGSGAAASGAASDDVTVQARARQVLVNTNTIISGLNTISPIITARNPAAGVGSGVRMQVFTASGTWTRPTGNAACYVIATGGGGPGGGSTTGTLMSNGGGGSGHTVEMYIANPPASAAVTIGQGGAASAVWSGGNNGGNTTFGTFLTAIGGVGGGGLTQVAPMGAMAAVVVVEVAPPGVRHWHGTLLAVESLQLELAGTLFRFN